VAPDEPVTVLQAVGSFIGTIKRDGEDLQAVQRDLNRFVCRINMAGTRVKGVVEWRQTSR
jgi:hypothetical protein